MAPCSVFSVSSRSIWSWVWIDMFRSCSGRHLLLILPSVEMQRGQESPVTHWQRHMQLRHSCEREPRSMTALLYRRIGCTAHQWCNVICLFDLKYMAKKTKTWGNVGKHGLKTYQLPPMSHAIRQGQTATHCASAPSYVTILQMNIARGPVAGRSPQPHPTKPPPP